MVRRESKILLIMLEYYKMYSTVQLQLHHVDLNVIINTSHADSMIML